MRSPFGPGGDGVRLELVGFGESLSEGNQGGLDRVERRTATDGHDEIGLGGSEMFDDCEHALARRMGDDRIEPPNAPLTEHRFQVVDHRSRPRQRPGAHDSNALSASQLCLIA